MKIINPTIKKLLAKYKEISVLGEISALLGWDLNVNLPLNGSKTRAEQSAYLAGLITSKWLDESFKSLVEKANSEKGLSTEEKTIVRNINYATKYFYKVPKEIIIKKEKVTSEAFQVWSQAREENNFKKFLPYLTEIIDLNRQIAKHLGYKNNLYDALLDRYNPELTAAECAELFNGLKKELVPLIQKIVKSKNYKDEVPFINNKIIYPIADQKKILEHMARRMGFDFASGRIDESAHPFTTTLGDSDIRFTTFYNESDFRESFTSTTHEAGHALYEQGINPEYAQTPLAGGVSLGVHEALSRFWENMVGKNPVFLKNFAPIFKSFYSKQLSSVDDTSLIQAFNMVKPSLIRIHADEVTYSLHIVLRFEMENGLINGKLSAKDAPAAWTAKSKELLGVEPKTDSQGVLQDVHWAYGEFGYFPSYALGNLYGAQFLDSMKKDIDFDKELEKGNLTPIKTWLDKKIHTHGSLYFPKDLVMKVTGKELDYKYFLNYLNQKYKAIYDLK